MSELFQGVKSQFSGSEAADKALAAPGEMLPPCCHSGCTVCVLDYPEMFMNVEPGGDELARHLAMLEAVEQALAQTEGQ